GPQRIIMPPPEAAPSTLVRSRKPGPMNIAEAKRALRAQALAKRKALPAENARRAARAVRDLALASVPFPRGATVAGYWPLADELDVRPLLEALAKRGHPCALPVVVARGARGVADGAAGAAARLRRAGSADRLRRRLLRHDDQRAARPRTAARGRHRLRGAGSFDGADREVRRGARLAG